MNPAETVRHCILYPTPFFVWIIMRIKLYCVSETILVNIMSMGVEYGHQPSYFLY